jgi:transcriptional regulator with XRE-family HTH domain
MAESAPTAVPARIQEALDLLDSRGISQAELARRLKVTAQSIGQWPVKGAIKVKNLTALAQLSGLSVAYLAGATDDRGEPAPDLRSDPLLQGAAIQRLVDQAVEARTRKLEGDIWSLRATLMTVLDQLTTTPGVAAELQVRQLALVQDPKDRNRHFQGTVSDHLAQAVARDKAAARKAG